MKKILAISAVCLLAIEVQAQLKLNIGIKAGLSFANITSTDGFNNNSRTGFMAGGYIAPKAKKLFGFRSEIILSRQGYDYKTATNTGNVNLDYLLLPQLLTLNFTKKLEIHAGGQLAFLLNAGVDSTGSSNNNSNLLNYFNRIDYGLVGGIQLSPFLGFFIGTRLNVSMKSITREQPVGSSTPAFIPT